MMGGGMIKKQCGTNGSKGSTPTTPERNKNCWFR